MSQGAFSEHLLHPRHCSEPFTKLKRASQQGKEGSYDQTTVGVGGRGVSKPLGVRMAGGSATRKGQRISS